MKRISSSLAGRERSGEHAKDGDGHGGAEYERQKCRWHETLVHRHRPWKAFLQS